MKNICHITTVHSRYDTRIFLKECSSLTKLYKVFLYILILTSVSSSFNSQKKELFELETPLINIEYIKPFVWGESHLKNPAYMNMSVLKEINKLHPLGIGGFTFNILKEGLKYNDSSKIALGAKYLNFLVTDYPYTISTDSLITYIYPFDFSGFKGKEWYSGMANASLGLAFALGYEIFQDSLYLDFAYKAFNSVISDIDKGGCSLKFEENSKWFLEYATRNSDTTNSNFVLNGFLHQLLALKIFADYTNDETYQNNYEKGLEGLRLKSKDFYYPDGNWTFYQLNPKSIEPPHYVIYDIILFESLYNISKDDLFLNEVETRRNIIKSHYNLQCKKTKNKKTIYFFSQIGTPHPYLVDIYPNLIFFNKIRGRNNEERQTKKEKKVIYSKKRELLKPRAIKYNILDRCFSLDTLSNMENISVYSKYFNDSILLFRTNTSELQEFNNSSAQKIEFKLNTNFELTKVDDFNLVFLNPAKEEQGFNRGRFTLELDSLYDMKKYLALIITPEIKIASIKIEIVDNKGVSAYRYYINSLKPQSPNIILLTKEGFKNGANIEISKINSVYVNIYSHPESQDKPFKLKINSILDITTNYQLYKLLNSNPHFFFPEKVKGGHLY